MKLSAIFIYYLFYIIKKSSANVYMHNPRGSNDRNCERNVNRDNGNRLFNRFLYYKQMCYYH